MLSFQMTYARLYHCPALHPTPEAFSCSSTPALVNMNLSATTKVIAPISHALKIMQSDFAAKLDVEQLAGEIRTSASTFHRAIKEITSDSPMQYLKKSQADQSKEFNCTGKHESLHVG